MKAFTVLALLMSLQFAYISADGLGVCSGGICRTANFKTIGCYNDQMTDRALPHYIYNERDSSHPTYGGRDIDWYDWNNWMPGFACRCATKAKELGYDVFGVQFWGECWAGKKAEHNYKRHGVATNKCFGEDYKSCGTLERFCMGEKETNMIYELVDLTCDVTFEHIGCFNDDHTDNARPLGNYVMNDRDSSHPGYSGISIDWRNWDTYMPQFACRCAKKAQENGKTFFGLQFYGECYTELAAEKNYAIDKLGTKCIDRCYNPCKSNEKYCMGEHYSNYVYRINGPCEVTITSIGCYNENPSSRVLKDLLYTAHEPDETEYFYGVLAKQQPWDDFFPDFLCRCARKAKNSGRTYFGVSDFGRCYSDVASDNYAAQGASTGCYEGNINKTCTSGSKKCSGENKEVNYIYKVA